MRIMHGISVPLVLSLLNTGNVPRYFNIYIHIMTRYYSQLPKFKFLIKTRYNPLLPYINHKSIINYKRHILDNNVKKTWVIAGYAVPYYYIIYIMTRHPINLIINKQNNHLTLLAIVIYLE